MKRGVVGIAALLMLVGFGGEKQFAGLSRSEATALSVEVAQTMRDPVDVADMFPRRGRVLIGTWQSRNSKGEQAWLTIFRLTGVANDPDQACIWAWRATGPPDPYGFEEVPSVAYGRTPDIVHDRCWAEVSQRGIAGPDQEMGSEAATEPLASPDVATPFGSRPAGLYPLDLAPGDAFSLTGINMDVPFGTTPGTCGFAGFVIDERTEVPVAGAKIAIVPSQPWSGISDPAWPPGAVTTVSDALGSFAFAELPFSDEGFDIAVRANGYAPSRTVHEECYPGELGIGDQPVAKEMLFDDATLYPVGR